MAPGPLLRLPLLSDPLVGGFGEHLPLPLLLDLGALILHRGLVCLFGLQLLKALEAAGLERAVGGGGPHGAPRLLAAAAIAEPATVRACFDVGERAGER